MRCVESDRAAVSHDIVLMWYWVTILFMGKKSPESRRHVAKRLAERAGVDLTISEINEIEKLIASGRIAAIRTYTNGSVLYRVWIKHSPTRGMIPEINNRPDYNHLGKDESIYCLYCIFNQGIVRTVYDENSI